MTIPQFIHIQPELTLLTRNYTFRMISPSDTRSPEYKVAVKTLEMPIALGFNIGALRIFGGPVFRLSSSQSCCPSEGDFKVNIRQSDVAMMLGLGFDIGKFFIDGRYATYGDKTKVSMSYEGVASRPSEVYNDEVWQFSAGFFF